MDVKDLVKKYFFHDVAVNYITLDENSRKVVLNLDYFIDENNIHQDTSANLNIIFYECLLWDFKGDTTLIEYSGSEINGTILTAELYTDQCYMQQGIKFFIQVDNYIQETQDFLTMIVIPEKITVTKNKYGPMSRFSTS